MITYNANHARAAVEPVQPAVPLADAIKAYWDGLATYAGLPDEAVTRETEDALYDDLVHQRARRLMEWQTSAQSMGEVLAALDLVERDMEGFPGDRMSGAMFKAALAYLKSETKTA